MEDIKKLKELLDQYKQIGKKPKKMSQGGMYNDGYAEGGKVSKEEKAPHNNKNLKKLKAAFDEFINEEGKEGYSDGGEIKRYADGAAPVTDDSSDPILDVIHAIGKKFNPPKASATPNSSPSPEDKYQQIREQNAQNFGHSSAGYSDGGKVPGSFSGRMYADGAAPVEPDDDDNDVDDNSNVASAPSQAPTAASAPVVSQGPDNSVKMDLGDIPIMAPKAPDEGPYPGEEEDAEQTSDQTTAAQLALQDLDDDKLDELHAHVKAEKDKREGKDKDAESEEDKALEDKMAAEDQTSKEQTPDDESTSGARLVAALNPQDEEEQPEQQSSLQQQLAKAQAQRDAILRADQMSRADELLAAGIAGHGASPASPAYINNGAMANAPIQSLQEKLSLQSSDPKSQMSQVVRDYMTSKGLPVPQNASADDLFKVAPFLQKDAALQNAIQKVLLQQQGAQGRNTATNLNRQQIADANRKAAMERQLAANEAKIKAATAGQEAKQAKEERDATVKAETDINSTRGKQALMLAQRNLMAVKNAQKMLQEFPDTNKWTSQQVALFNSEIAKIATNGVPTEGMVNELTNPTAAASMSKLASKIINVPVGAQQGKFIALNKQYLDGLSDVANQTIRDNLGNTIKSYQPKLGNDAYKNLVYRHSDMLGLFSPAEERGIGAVMKAKGLSRQDAIKALIQEKVLKDVNY
jgi:hypothetical protein